jgi:outer membrane protein TolC
MLVLVFAGVIAAGWPLHAQQRTRARSDAKPTSGSAPEPVIRGARMREVDARSQSVHPISTVRPAFPGPDEDASAKPRNATTDRTKTAARRPRTIIPAAQEQQPAPAADREPIPTPPDEPEPVRTRPRPRRPLLDPLRIDPLNPLDEVPTDVGSAEDRARDERVDLPEAELPLDVPELPSLGVSMPQPDTELTLEEVVQRVDETFPLIIAAIQERGATEGQLLAAIGAFDLQLTGNALPQPLGFYQNFRYQIGLEQLTAANGTRVFAGYRLGRGHFPVYFGERETYGGGEFITGVTVPLLQGGPIDRHRAELYKARYARQAAEPVIQAARIEFTKAATQAYWDWVEAGKGVDLSENLLELAVIRDEQLKRLAELGAVKPIDQVDNRRLIPIRQAKLVGFRRKFQESQLKLSLYYRDEFGTPLIAGTQRLPIGFPEIEVPDWEKLRNDGIEMALRLRPELQSIQLERQMKGVDLDLARNEFLPTLDFMAMGRQHVGAPTEKRDQSPFVLEAGLLFGVPLQRRFARGKINETTAKLTKLGAYMEYTRNTIVNEVLDAVSEIAAAHDQVEYARTAVLYNARMERAERIKIATGDADLLDLQFRETFTFDSRLQVISETAAYYRAWARYRAAVGLAAASDASAAAAETTVQPSNLDTQVPGE